MKLDLVLKLDFRKTLLLLVVSACLLLYLTSFGLNVIGSAPHLCENEDKETLRTMYLNPPNISKELLVSGNDISTIIQNQIGNIQRKNCNELNFICGHNSGCGFGCQFHHRIACLMLSYATNMPLIHDENVNDGWPYNARWGNVFQKLGSNCSPGPNTFKWTWTNHKTLWHKYRGTYYCANKFQPIDPSLNSLEEIPFPLSFGIPIRAELGDKIENLYSNNSFFWMIGQFAKYAFKFNEEYEAILNLWRMQVFTGNSDELIVGVHVRRGDKITEWLESFHELNVYLEEIEKYFVNLEKQKDIIQGSLIRRVFWASDDPSLLPIAKTKQPTWIFSGFNSNAVDPSERSDGLFEIVRDVSILSDCSYVICGLSSNICRLVLEILYSKHDDAEQRFKSLDDEYIKYSLLNHHIRNMKLWKI